MTKVDGEVLNAAVGLGWDSEAVGAVVTSRCAEVGCEADVPLAETVRGGDGGGVLVEEVEGDGAVGGGREVGLEWRVDDQVRDLEAVGEGSCS